MASAALELRASFVLDMLIHIVPGTNNTKPGQTRLEYGSCPSPGPHPMGVELATASLVSLQSCSLSRYVMPWRTACYSWGIIPFLSSQRARRAKQQQPDKRRWIKRVMHQLSPPSPRLRRLAVLLAQHLARSVLSLVFRIWPP